MAKKFKKMASIKETEGGNFGNYEEYNGGGSPKGGIWGGRNGRVGWDERQKQGEVSESEHRENQPRTSDGKFTYNSVNGKETKYDGRGETVNPLLTGGKNGIKIDDVKNEFQAKSGNLYDKYKDKWYQKGSMKVTKEGKKYVIKISSDDIWEIARKSFDISKGEFGGESKTFEQTKAGAPGKFGTAAKAEAKKTGQEQYVKTGEGAIAKFKDADGAAKMAKRLGKSKDTAQLTHSPAQINQVRNMMLKAGYDISGITDEQIDAVVDEFIQF